MIGQSTGQLTGTWTLLRLMLRRDRVRLPGWVLGMAALTAYFANALGAVVDEESLAGLASLATTPVMGLIGGPGYGFDDITLPRLFAGMYGLYLMIGAALMAMTTVSRHTRVEEQTGRAELLRANVVGRHAQLVAALLLSTLMSVLLTAVMWIVVQFSVMEPGPTSANLIFVASVGAVGLVFTGVAAVTVQLSPFSRVGSSVAGAVLAVAFVIRGLGDMSALQQGHDGGVAWLSWLSPLGWSQQTAPYTLDRWWPLLFSVGTTVILTGAGVALQSRRDLTAGLVADRPGPATAATWLDSPVALAFRLQRASLVGWSVAMLVAGVIFGAFAGPMADGADSMPPEIIEVLGGTAGVVEGYLGFMGIYFAVMIAVYALLSVQSLRSQEQGFHTETVLSTAVSRRSWQLSWTGVTAVGALWLSALAGLGEGIGAAAGLGDAGLIGRTLLGHMAQVPAVWVLLGVAVLLYGALPRFVGLAWALLGYSTLLVLFGEMIELPEGVLDTSVFRHVGQYPAEALSWAAVGALTALAALFTALGTRAFGRRDLVTT
ncbi:ABC transporter permease [Corynebacterium glyciniphilum]|uniref:ABC transporter permease n=1 Tax=Corynebacterium glyciniphilum TaxID=1404244 RepID=UPI0011AB6372|nr:ABC transporter permease [Corynebacterium glyciniphilum]